MCQFANWCYSMRPFLFTDRITKLRFQSAVTYHAQLESVSVETYSYPKCDAISTGNRTRVDDIRDHPYMRPNPFMHIPGHLPAANVQLLKDGRLAPSVMDINGTDMRMPLNDLCQQG